MGVAEPAIAALGDDDALAGVLEVGKQRVALLVEHLRALGHFQHGVGAASAGAVLAHAVHAGLGLEMLLVAEVDQRVEAVGAFDHDVAAAAAVAPVRAAELDELLAPERDAAGAALAGADIDASLIKELHERFPEPARRRAWRAARSTRRAPKRNDRSAPGRRAPARLRGPN